VHIVHEPDNPYDGLALAVVTVSGDTIGYVPRDCWLQDAVHDDGKGCDATIKSIGCGEGGKLGVVLDVCLNSKGFGERQFSRATTTARASGQKANKKTTPKGWLARLFNP